jgi:hypothetical protein
MKALRDGLGTGDLIVLNILKSWNYEIEIPLDLKPTAIVAFKPSDKLLVYVVSAECPDRPAIPSLNVISPLNRYARTIKAEFWIAKVQLTQNGELEGNISWERLSPQ